jgi:radical SAM superfamily enzyme YgiQ (UPF0313 family)
MINQKIVLINPNNKGNSVQGMFMRENLGLCYIATYLRNAGFEVQIIDARIENSSPESVASRVIKIKPFLIGFSVIAKTAIDWCEETAKIIRDDKNNIPHICLGNYFPTLQPTRALESMPSADSVVLGEGEITIVKLANCLFKHTAWRHLVGLAYRTKSKIIVNKRRKLVRNLNKLLLPDHYASEHNLPEFAIEGSRGCYRACSFCSIGPFIQARKQKDRWRFRSAINMVKEIKDAIKKYPLVKIFRFIDPDFIGSPQHLDRLKEFISILKKEKLDITFIIDTRTEVVNDIPYEIWKEFYNVGLREIFLGVETTIPAIKKKMLKYSGIDGDIAAINLLSSLNIRTRFGFMMITPWSTEEDLIINANVLRHLGFSRLDKYFQEMYLVPGTNAINLVDKNVKIWFDYGGKGEYYTYELPSPLKELRTMCRFLVEQYQDFFNQIQSVHEKIRQREIKGDEVKNLKEKMNDFNYNIFLDIINIAKKTSGSADSKSIKEYTNKIVENYKPQIISLEKEVNFIKKIND